MAWNTGEITVAGTANVDLSAAPNRIAGGVGFGGVFFIDLKAVGTGTWTFLLQQHLSDSATLAGSFVNITTVSAGLNATGATNLALAAPFVATGATPYPDRIVVTRTAGAGSCSFVLTADISA